MKPSTEYDETKDLVFYHEPLQAGAVILKAGDFVIVSPTQNKKFATGNGSADKDLMVFSWKKIEKCISDITEIKIDDLADAYFLSNYWKSETI